MKTSFSRTFFPIALILLAALILVGASFQALVRDFLQKQAMETLRNDSVTLARVASAYYTDDAFDTRELFITLSTVTSVSDVDAVICNSKGKLLICSDSPIGCTHQGMVLKDPKFLQTVASSAYVESKGYVRGLYDDARYIVSVPIRDAVDNKVVGIVIASIPQGTTQSVLQRLSELYMLVSLLVVLVAVVVMTLYARSVSAPLRDMARAASAFGHGDLTARVKTRKRAPVEIREFSLAFNNMADSLQKSEAQRKDFVANISHELKTPMTTIGGYIDGILDGTIPQEKHRHYMSVVSQETHRLSRLVRSMLDISRLQEGGIPDETKTRFDVCECAGSALISFERQITDKALCVSVDFPEHAVYAFANRDGITQVFYNLLDNAVKFCPPEGSLWVQLRESDHKIFVTIGNDGPTIPAQELPLLFDRFHKLDKSRSENRDGWGLGLYIVKTIICGHGQDICVSSRDEKTEFTFTLPLANT